MTTSTPTSPSGSVDNAPSTDPVETEGASTSKTKKTNKRPSKKRKKSALAADEVEKENVTVVTAAPPVDASGIPIAVTVRY